MDHVHEGPAELLTLRRNPLLLQRAAEHLPPTRARPDLRRLHHECVRNLVWKTDPFKVLHLEKSFDSFHALAERPCLYEDTKVPFPASSFQHKLLKLVELQTLF